MAMRKEAQVSEGDEEDEIISKISASFGLAWLREAAKD
jgi:hypothetical protein